LYRGKASSLLYTGGSQQAVVYRGETVPPVYRRKQAAVYRRKPAHCLIQEEARCYVYREKQALPYTGESLSTAVYRGEE